MSKKHSALSTSVVAPGGLFDVNQSASSGELSVCTNCTSTEIFFLLFSVILY